MECETQDSYLKRACGALIRRVASWLAKKTSQVVPHQASEIVEVNRLQQQNILLNSSGCQWLHSKKTKTHEQTSRNELSLFAEFKGKC
jgi:hypothetical protein